LRCSGEVTAPLRLTLEQLIRQDVIATAVYTAATGSTNSDALDEVQRGGVEAAALPRVHLTDRQQAGRGRQGKSWHSDADSLTFSLVTAVDPAAAPLGLLPLTVGVAVAEGIEAACGPCRVGLKWPNDLCACVADRRASSRRELFKLGGILIETAGSAHDRAVIGVGLNVNRAPPLTGNDATPAMSLSDFVQCGVSRGEVLAAVLEMLRERLTELARGAAVIVDQYRQRCVLEGTELTLHQSGRVLRGHCLGIAADGALELSLDGRVQRFRSGEVRQVRRSS
jgi:BirA family biotin operon repressor/biotin-[acetyl-CoA-carboxylase] ligase